MIRNYLKIALRSLLKQKLYAAINIVGLALGMACTLLIGLWVRDELSYDRFLPDAGRLYFVRVNYNFRGGPTQTAYATPGPLQEAIARDVPEVAVTTKTTFDHELLMKAVGVPEGGVVAKERGYFATADFFSVFNLPSLAGLPKTALAQPSNIIITKKTADKYFPDAVGHYAAVLGKRLQLDNAKFYTVGAVIDDLPTNSTLQFGWLINFKNCEEEWMNEWGTNGFLTYVRLKPNTTPARAEATMRTIYRRYATFNNRETPILHPITDQRLYSEYANGQVVGGRIEYVRIFSLVALFILVIACINFMNLATARSAMRAKEVGVRKVVGARRSSLIEQFLSESLLTSLLAGLLALGFVWAMLPTFNTVFDKQLMLALGDPALWLIAAALMLITGLLSGSYPALILSSLQPIRILRGTDRVIPLSFGAHPILFRRVLVVFQFSLSIFLVVGMLALSKQMNFLRTKNLGLDRENVIYIPLEGEIASKPEPFRQEVMQLPTTVSVTTAAKVPVHVQNSSTDLNWAGKDPTQLVSVSTMAIGNDFIRTMNIKLLGGRDFRSGTLADSANYLINETAAKLMHMTKPVGQEITFWRGKGRVIGLMQDFHLNSLHQAITPLVLVYYPANTNYLLVKTRAGQTRQAITDLERLAKRFNPNYPFTYHFVDEDYQKLYNAEQQVSTLVNSFGILAILISCLGLFALAAFTAEQRTKEIGVRKVLGASVASIVILLSSDFLRLVCIALVLASPLAWWAVSQWLSTFAYRTELTWWVFGVAGGLAVVIALLTVSFQSVKAALMNPVHALRSE